MIFGLNRPRRIPGRLPGGANWWAGVVALMLAMLVFPGSVQGVPGSQTKRPLLSPNGRPPKTPPGFVWTTSPVGGFDVAAGGAEAFGGLPLDAGLFTLLIIGSDARPGESMLRSRGDSIHLLVVNPATKTGTIVGFPRDSYVDIVGHGKSKITSALSWGGPALMVDTVRRLTKIPVTHYVVTGFAGFTALIDSVGGVNVLVDPAMNDRFSGATFAKGWFSMNGNAALAFNRDRHDVANGDFGRSANQGKFLLSALARMQESTNDARGLLTWVTAVTENSATNLPPKDLLKFAQAARIVRPGAFRSVVAPGRNASVKTGRARQAVVVLTPAAFRLFDDVAVDGVVGG